MFENRMRIRDVLLLSVEEELALGNRIRLTRKMFRTRILESPQAISDVADLLEGVLTGDSTLSRTLRIDTKTAAPRKKTMEILPGIVQTLREEVSLGGEAFFRQESAETPEAEKCEIRSARKTRIRNCLCCLDPLSFQSRIFLSLKDKLIATSDRLSQIRRERESLEQSMSKESAVKIHVLEGERDEILAHVQETPLELNARCREISERLDQYESAKRRLSSHNLPLVVSIARKYENRGVSVPELVQEGSMGLSVATDRFDVRRGYKFSTYAYRGIQNAITDSIKRAQTARKTSHRISLDRPVGAENGTDGCFGNYIENASVQMPPDEAQHRELKDRLERVFQTLPYREREVVKLRFGINAREHSCEEIGKMFGVTYERIRQIQKSTLRRLQHLDRSDTLLGFIEET